MRFVDCVTLRVSAGHGGAGAVAWRREKFVPKGGPAGGNGGKGGSVVVLADRNVGTLLDFRYRKHVAAERGQGGMTNLADGRDGQDQVLRVPVGTLVRDAMTGELLVDLKEDGQQAVVAAGGRGGLGNARFKTSVNQSPSYAQPGEPGGALTISLELKLLADIGIIGFPSVGKSTLIAAISNARPKIADYPFTTLVPNLGLVRWRDERDYVVADIPGLIEGAHEGKGLGYQFLRHVERCRALVHILEVTPSWEGMDDGRDPIADFETINRELALFSQALADRPQIVALAKMDLPFVQEREEELRVHFEALGMEFYSFSSASHEGLQTLIDAMGRLAAETPAPDVALFTSPAMDEDELAELGDEGDDFDYYDDELDDDE